MAKSKKRKTGNKAHRVNLCRWARPAGKGDGGRMALFAFSWQDLVVLTGIEVRKLQRMARAKKFDPRDLESVATLWLATRRHA